MIWIYERDWEHTERTSMRERTTQAHNPQPTLTRDLPVQQHDLALGARRDTRRGAHPAQGQSGQGQGGCRAGPDELPAHRRSSAGELHEEEVRGRRSVVGVGCWPLWPGCLTVT